MSTHKLLNLTPKQVQQRLDSDDNVIFVDVRSYAENKFVGHPPNTILISWIDAPDWHHDTESFVKQLGRTIMTSKNIQSIKDAEIILICRSGHRSTLAGNCLLNNGFENVANVIGGFEGDLDEFGQRGNLNGWRHDGLTWMQH